MKKGSLFGKFIQYASLNVLGMVGLSCYILADTFFVSQGLGAGGLTALNLAIPAYSLLHGTGLMLGMGGTIQYAVAKGQQAEKTVTDEIFTRTIELALVIALGFFALGLWGSRQVTALLGADAEVFAMTHCYVRMILLFAPAFVFNNLLICFVRNDGNPRLSMLAMLGGSMSNIVLDYVFIFPLEMGMFGAALATSLAPVISISVLSFQKWLGKNQFHLVQVRQTLKAVGHTLSLGLPSLVTELSSGIVILVFNWLMLGLGGNVGVAAYGVIANLSLVVVSIYTGVAQGMQPLLSDSYGRGAFEDVRQVLRYGLAAVVGLSVLVYGLVFCFAGPITQIFNRENLAQLQKIAEEGMRVYFTGILFAGMNILFSAFFAATEKPMPAHGISWLRGILLAVPLAFLLSWAGGLLGLWLVFPLTEGLTAAFSLVMDIRLRKERS